VRTDAEQLEARFASLEQNLAASALTHLLNAARKVRSAAANLDGSRTGSTAERPWFFDANVDALYHGVGPEQHGRHFFGGHFDQMVAAKFEQRRDLVCDQVVVDGQVDAPRSSGSGYVGMQREVESHALCLLPLARANAHDTVELQAVDPDDVHQCVTRGLVSISKSAIGQVAV